MFNRTYVCRGVTLPHRIPPGIKTRGDLIVGITRRRRLSWLYRFLSILPKTWRTYCTLLLPSKVNKTSIEGMGCNLTRGGSAARFHLTGRPSASTQQRRVTSAPVLPWPMHEVAPHTSALGYATLSWRRAAPTWRCVWASVRPALLLYMYRFTTCRVV